MSARPRPRSAPPAARPETPAAAPDPASFTPPLQAGVEVRHRSGAAFIVREVLRDGVALHGVANLVPAADLTVLPIR